MIHKSKDFLTKKYGLSLHKSILFCIFAVSKELRTVGHRQAKGHKEYGIIQSKMYKNRECS